MQWEKDASEEEWFETNSSQRRLFTLQMFNPTSIVYNLVENFKVEGDLDLEKLLCAVQQVVHRNSALRTNFDVVDGEVKARIKKQMPVSIKEIYLDSLSLEASDILLNPFDLTTDDLIRFSLVHTKTDTYFQIETHHVMCDGISYKILLQEIIALYQENELLPVKKTFKDLIALENDKQKHRESFLYWEKIYEKVPEPLNLPVDFPRVSRNDFEGSQIVKYISERLKEKIILYCSKRQATPYMFFLTAFVFFLCRLTNQKDIVVATPMNSRIYEDTQNVVGMFVNTVPLKMTLVENMDFDELLEQVQEQTLNGFINQNCPLEDIINYTGANKDFTRNPLFDVVLSYNDFLEEEHLMGNVKLKRCEIAMDIARFELVLDILDVKDSFRVRWEYKKNLFKPETIEYFHKELIQLIESNIIDV